MSRKLLFITLIIIAILLSSILIASITWNEKNKYTNGEIAILVHSNIYKGIKNTIDTLQRYSSYKFIIKTITNENPREIRDWLENEYVKREIHGALLVGNIPIPKYENLTNKEVMDFPYYYMDLNGKWSDINKNGIIDTPSGNNKAEIWIGIIRSSNKDGDNISEINNYLDKVINYLRGNVYSEPRSIEFIDNDFFMEQGDVSASLKFLYPFTNMIYGDNANKKSLESILSENYSYGFFAMHSNGWNFFLKYKKIWEKVTPEDIINSNPRILFYTLSSCYAGSIEKGQLANKILMNSRALGIITYSYIAYVDPMTSMFMKLAKDYSIGNALLYYINSMNFSKDEFNRYIAPLIYFGVPFLKMWKPHGYKETSPLIIKSNNDLFKFKKKYGWMGDGSKNNPIKISGLLIFRNTTYSVSFYERGIILINISLHVIISNSYILIAQSGRDSIEILNSRNIVIKNCILWGGGIFVYNSSYIKIEDNTIDYSWVGVYLSGGIKLSYNTTTPMPIIQKIYYEHRIAVENNLMYNTGNGIWIDRVNNSLIQYNNIIKSFSPFTMYKSNYNLIRWNIFRCRNISYIYINKSDYNSIYGNNFYGNLTKIYLIKCVNYWNTSTYGNYWEIWANKNNTNDQNNDGIVDFPFIINKDNIDKFPLKNPYKYPTHKVKNENSKPYFQIIIEGMGIIIFIIFIIAIFRKKYRNK